MKPSAERHALIAELERRRHEVGRDLDGLNESLDFQRRLRDSVRQHPGWWIGGGLAAGLILSRLLLPGRSRSGPKKSGGESRAFLSLLGIAGKEILRLSTPALKQAAGRQLEQWLGDRHPPKPGDAEADDDDSFPPEETHTHG